MPNSRSFPGIVPLYLERSASFLLLGVEFEMENKKIEGALKTVALRKCPRDYWLDTDDVKAFSDLVESSKVCKGSEVTYSCQANFNIRVYSRNPVKDGAAIGGATTAVAGTAGGAAAGVVIGAAAGTVVPVVGNIVGGVLGGIIGGVTGLVAGGLGGAGVGAGIGRAVSDDNPVLITARDVFHELPEFREKNNTVSVTYNWN